MRNARDFYEEGVNSPSELFLLQRALGKTSEQSLRDVARAYGVHGQVNLRNLAETCMRAEAREQAAIEGKS